MYRTQQKLNNLTPLFEKEHRIEGLTTLNNGIIIVDMVLVTRFTVLAPKMTEH